MAKELTKLKADDVEVVREGALDKIYCDETSG